MAEPPDRDDASSRPHSHLIAFPEALEAFFTRVGELKTILGPRFAPGVDQVEALIRQGLAARDRGDAPDAVRWVVEAMRRLAVLAGESGAAEGPMLAAVAERFAEALDRGALGQARETAEVMREQSGARLLPRRDR